MNKKLQEIKRLLQNAEDSDNIKEMEMQIVKLELVATRHLKPIKGRF